MAERPDSSSLDPAEATTLAGLFRELQRRRVIRVGLVYTLASWVIIQVAETVFPPLSLPDWTVTLVVVLCLLGFPIALILAWAYRLEPEETSPDTPAAFTLSPGRKIDFAVIGLLSVAVALLGYGYFSGDVDSADVPQAADTTDAAPAAATIRSIAVLPFENFSTDEANAYFGKGLAEEVIHALTRVPELSVASRMSSFQFIGTDIDARKIGELLNVATIVEGSVRQGTNGLRVTAQLVDTETGYHLWSAQYDEPIADVLNIQDDIARQIVASLDAVLSGSTEQLLSIPSTDNFDAYELVLQGRELLEGEASPAQLENAETLFRQATLLDPRYVGALSGLCDSLLQQFERLRSPAAFEKAERACHRGLTLDAGNAELHNSIGHLYLYSGQHDKAVDEFGRAIALNPRNIDAYFGLAETYEATGNAVRAEATFRDAALLQPGDPRAYLRLGNFYYYAGRNAEAIEAYRTALRWKPDSAKALLNYGSALYLNGDFERAAMTWEKSLAIDPTSVALANIGSSYFFLGRFDDAAGMYLEAIDLAPEDFEAWGALGDAYRHSADQQDNADAAYRRAIELGENLLSINPSDPMTLGPLSGYHAYLGNDTRARELIERALDLAGDNVYVHYFAAATFATLGDIDRGVTALEKAIELGYPTLLIEPDAQLATLVADKRISGSLE